jgi:Hemerythrin HHE cation binding domain
MILTPPAPPPVGEEEGSSMTVATAPDPIEAIKASPIPFDLYHEVHKGLRHALFQLVTRVGSADCTDAQARSAVADQVRSVIHLLTEHHDHEDTFIEPVIRAKAPKLALILAEGHTEVEQELVEIELRADRLATSAGTEAVTAGLDLYAYLSLFVARYLTHMSLEEGAVMAALRDRCTIEELFGIQVAVRSSVTPDIMCEFLTALMPALNPEERVAMLGGMHAFLPPEIFELFRATTEAAIAPADYATLAAHIRLA